MSFHREHAVKKTRKTCSCDWCCEVIEKGASCVVAIGVYDGDFFSKRYHPECDEAIVRWCKREGWGEELPDEGMNRGGIEPKGEPEDMTNEMP
jgi:hypothetical protein